MNQASKAIVNFILTHLVEQRFLSGYRSYFAGASSVLGGVILALDMLAGGTYSDERAGAAFAAIVFGYHVIGAAGKADKAAAAKAGASPAKE